MTDTPDDAPRDRRSVPLLELLADLWLRRDGRRWIVHGHDEHGRSASIRVHFDERGVALIPSSPGGIVFAPLQVGRLRAAIRDAIESIDQPTAAARHIANTPVPRPVAKRWPPSPQPRGRAVLGDGFPATRPNFRPLKPASLLMALGADGHSTEPIWPEQNGDGPSAPGGQGATPDGALPAGSPPRRSVA